MMKVSIIIPVYNVEKYLKECLESVVNQSLNDIEVICVNDGSTDNSLDILNEYSNKYNNIKVITQENKGLGLTRNVGIKLAKGEYIYFLDSDDYIDLECINICYKECKYNDLDILTFDAESFYDDSLESSNIRDEYNRKGLEYLGVIDGREFYIKSKKLRKYKAPVWLNFYKTSFIRNNNLLFEDTLHEDEIHTFKSLLKAKRVKYINKKLFNRRLRANSIMISGITKERVYAYINILKCFLYEYNNCHTNNVELKDIIEKEINHFIYCIVKFSSILKTNIKNEIEKILSEYNFIYDINTELNINCNTIYSINSLNENKSYEFKILDKPKIYYMLIPEHGNLGDQAIVYSILMFLKNNYPDYDIVKIKFKDTEKYTDSIKENFKEGDFIVLHGGGNMGNHYIWEEEARRYIIKSLKGLPIISFTQTIYFSDDESGQEEFDKTKYIYSSNERLVLLAREEKSYNIMKKHFTNDIYLCPDIVFYLNNKLKCRYNTVKRKQIMTCFRTDKETHFDIKEKDKLIKELSLKYSLFKNDTIVNRYVNDINREEEILSLLDEYYKSKVVITDRLHGMIFAVITNTPCIVLRSFDHKVIESYKWIQNLSYIKIIENIDIGKITNLVTELENIKIENNLNFDKDYFNNIKRIIDDSLIYHKETLNKKIFINDITFDKNSIECKFKVSNDLKKYFNYTIAKIDYYENIEQIPKSIAYIPIVSNILPIVWFTDSELIVEELDKEFFECIDNLKSAFEKMCDIKLGGNILVNKIVTNNFNPSKDCITLFSGGADSLCTVIENINLNPILATIWGSDISIYNKKGWNNIENTVLNMSNKLNLKNIFIKSNFRDYINNIELNKLLLEKNIVINSNEKNKYKSKLDCWWTYIQHGISLISQLSPYAYKHKIKKILVPGTLSQEYLDKVGKIYMASLPSIDNKFRFSSCEVFHHGFEYDRYSKIKIVSDYINEKKLNLNIRVCFTSLDGLNCNLCKKCSITILSLIHNKKDPNKFGFKVDDKTLVTIKHNYENIFVFDDFALDWWKNIKSKFNENRNFWLNYPSLSWILDIDTSDEFNKKKALRNI